MNTTEIDKDYVREMMYLKAMSLKIPEEDIDKLDRALCSLLEIKNPEPFLYPF
ncbi:hypothetical protein N9P17_02595 [Tateyamaria sp.]|nr:hypothetical protein [Tateyamaria sp.]